MSATYIYPQQQFRARVLEEWRRAERSGKPEILALLHGMRSVSHGERLLHIVSSSVRETDLAGWYDAERTVGILFVELGKSSIHQALNAIEDKIKNQLRSRAHRFAADVTLELQVLPPPASGDSGVEEGEVIASLRNHVRERAWAVTTITRVFDIVGALLLLIALSPVFLMIALSIRLSSRGPALFYQPRVGFRGRIFGLYKFRTMESGTDDSVHREYARRFVTGKAERHLDDSGQPVFKLTNDSRVTRVGRLLRRTSLDELPQLWNVLRGEMSLVGPRPPLPYEAECYELWHRRRICDLKPGVTGLWQVRGRSSCTFDEMTRLDLRHAQGNALGLYFRVLLETPRAVLRGHGAH